jgi:hypothetical protein
MIAVRSWRAMTEAVDSLCTGSKLDVTVNVVSDGSPRKSLIVDNHCMWSVRSERIDRERAGHA